MMNKKILHYFFLLLFVAGAFFLGTAYADTRELFIAGFYGENRLIQDVKNLLGKEYLGQINDSDLYYGMVRGMVKALNDPYSEFFDPQEAKIFWDDLGGEFEGIGVEIVVDNGRAKILTVLDNSPAKKAGLEAGDVILAVDDTDVSGKSLGEIASMIQGNAGTEVVLTVLRGTEELLDISLVREKMKADSVYIDSREEVLIVRIIRFDEDTDKEFKNKLVDYDLTKYRGMIVDVRSNPGGYFDSCVNLADEFLSEGLIVVETDNKSLHDEFTAESGQVFESIPLIILIDEGSASASEILAGAIKDNARGKIVGQKSYGKGTVQVIEELFDGSILKLTVAEWLTPSGINISEGGIVPNVEVIDEGEGDKQMEKAIEILRQ